jgi:serine/threonine protein kinase
VSADCPPREVLEHLLSGTLPSPQHDTVSTHFISCPRCHATADEIIQRSGASSIQLGKPGMQTSLSPQALNSLLEILGRIVKNSANEPQRISELPTVGGAATVTVNQADPLPGSAGTIGPYKLVSKLGEGGFGIVYRAEQDQPLRRTVALKIIKPGMDSREVIARFETERQSLALMDHPHIARVLDAGETSSGRPYFVMELVAGRPITEYCDQHRLTLRDRLTLFLSICEAVEHAHQKGIIHRDLKPSNVLITERNGVPDAKIIDFGIAKALTQSTADARGLTRVGQMIGTLLYMSPEQVGGADIDTRSDVYSLGVLLYELLVGVLPFDTGRVLHLPLPDAVRVIREEEPDRPSLRLANMGEQASGLAFARQRSIRDWTRQLRQDLDWIVLKTLEKDRRNRYVTASALAADIQRYLNDEPVQASPPSVTYRLQKALRRHRLLLTVVLVIFASLSAGTIAALSQAHRADEERLRANQKASDALEAEERAKQQAAVAIRERERADEKGRLAESVVDRFYSELAEKWAQNEPRTTPLQLEFLAAAAKFYDQLAQETDGTQEVLRKQVESLRRAGRLYGQIGVDEAADDAFERGLAILGRLRDEFGTTSSLGELASRFRIDYATFLHSRDHIRQAEAELQLAVESLKPLVEADPANAKLIYLQARAHQRLGVTQRLRGHDDQSTVALSASLNSLSELVERFPRDSVYRSDLAMTHLFIGRPLGFDGKLARPHFDAALKILETLVHEEPSVPLHRLLLARGRCWYGEKYRGQPGAADVLAKGVEGYRALVADHPTHAQYLAEWTFAQSQQAIRFLPVEQRIPACLQLINQLEELVQVNPQSRELSIDLAFACNHLAVLYLKSGQFEQAAQAASKAAGIWERELAEAPANPWWCRERLGAALQNHSIAAWNQGLKEGVVAERVRSIVLRSEVRNKGIAMPMNSPRQPLLAEITLQFSDRYFQDVYHAGTVHEYELALAAHEIVLNDESATDVIRSSSSQDMILGYAECIRLCDSQQRPEEALQYLQKRDNLHEWLFRSKLASIIKGDWSTYADNANQFAQRLISLSRDVQAVIVVKTALELKTQLGVLQPGTLQFTGATAAALAGTRVQSPPIDEGEQRMLRLQSRQWLMAELNAWKLNKRNTPPADISAKLARWSTEAALDGVRSAEALGQFTEEERTEWLAFWKEVEDFRLSLAPPAPH